jgi:hypothetical protein
MEQVKILRIDGRAGKNAIAHEESIRSIDSMLQGSQTTTRMRRTAFPRELSRKLGLIGALRWYALGGSGSQGELPRSVVTRPPDSFTGEHRSDVGTTGIHKRRPCSDSRSSSGIRR